jgi:hypothetical protein
MPEQVCQPDFGAVLVPEAIVLFDDRARRQAPALLRKPGEMSSDFDLLGKQSRPCLGVVRSFILESARTFRGEFLRWFQLAHFHVTFLPWFTLTASRFNQPSGDGDGCV